MPGYTKEPSQGELTLVGGKKLDGSGENEYEMNVLESGNLERIQTGCSHSRSNPAEGVYGLPSVEDGGQMDGGEETMSAEQSPPYLPPPERARVRSSPERSRGYPDEVYITALGPGGRRVQF